MSEYRPLKKERGVLRISLFEILAVLYIAHKVLPAVGYYMPGVVYLGIFGLTMVLLLPMFRYQAAWYIFGYFIISLLTLFIKLKSLSGGVLYLYGELQIYLYGIIALRLILSGDQKACRRMFAILIFMYMVTALTTIIGNNQYPQASRILATLSNGDFLHTTYTKANIGNFSFVYELVLLAPLLIYLTRSKIIKPVFGYALLALCAVTIFTTEYGMAVILFFTSLLLLVIPKLTTKQLIVLMVIILIVLVFFTPLIAQLFEQLSMKVESRTLSERFLTVAQALSGEDVATEDGTGAARTQLYQKSLDAFWKSSCLGGWGNAKTGGHSFVFDAMGSFGLLGIAGLIVLISTINKLCLKPYRKQAFYPFLLWTTMLGIALMFLNPKSYPFIFLCVLPLFSVAFKDQKQE